MNIVVILGSPRKKGNSQTLAETVVSAITASHQSSVEYLYLHGMKDLNPCLGCGGCEKTGMCVVKDDLIELYQKVDEADIIFLVTPVYFYGPTAQLKTLIDRFQARWSRKYLLHQRFRRNDKRRGYLLATAATKGDKVFDPCILIAKSFFDTIDVDYGDDMVVRSVDERGALKNNDKELDRARRFGKEIARTFETR